LINNTYYDWARNYDPMTGMFDQADYGYSGSLADPMTDLPYTFTGGDPINMLDLNGHDFSLGEVSVDVSIDVTIDSVEEPALAPALSSAENIVTASRVLSTLLWAGGIGGAGVATMELELAAGRALEPLVSSLTNVEELAIDNGVATKNKLDKLPIFWVFKYGPFAVPQIWKNDATAIKSHPYWALLTYIGPNNPLRKTNRGAALAAAAARGIVAGPGQSLDEYPFATSFQGGAGAQVMAVNRGEQGSQAGLLNAFYAGELNYVPLSPFLVIPVPFPPP
jgi:hypothetical protein